MRILLLSATRAELAPTLHWLKERDYQAGGHIVIAGTSGIGCMMTAWWLGRYITDIRPQLVIQAGVAGSFAAGWTPAQPLAVERDTLADLGVWEGARFRTVFDLQLLPGNQPPFQDGWLNNPHQRLLKESGLPIATAITVNQITTSEADNTRLTDMGAQLESMEGAALHYACRQACIPFLQIRTVSNTVGVRNKSEWQLAPAIQSLNQYLQQWLPTLKSEWL